MSKDSSKFVAAGALDDLKWSLEEARVDAARLTPVDGETLSRRRERRLAQVRRMIDEAPAIVAQRELEVARLEAERARRGLR